MAINKRSASILNTHSSTTFLHEIRKLTHSFMFAILHGCEKLGLQQLGKIVLNTTLGHEFENLFSILRVELTQTIIKCSSKYILEASALIF